jgi:hypothetical protein
MSNVKVSGRFRNKEGLYGIELFHEKEKPVPYSVVVRFSDAYGDFAEYSLVRVGPKGV